MKPFFHVRRLLAALSIVTVFSTFLLLAESPGTFPTTLGQARAVQAKRNGPRAWPMFGGTPQRNMVNLVDKNIPTTWSVEKGKERNIVWSARLGTRAYGGPVVSSGKVFFGTNNGFPRDPKIRGDQGILMCFREADGKFLWQAVHDKLPAGLMSDWPEYGIPSVPVIEGNRLYYVSNHCQLVCAGTADGKAHWTLDMIKELKVFPHNLAICSPLIAGDLLFVVTANGVDEGHVNIPSPQAPSFIAVHKKTGKVQWQSNLPSRKLVGSRALSRVARQQLQARGEVIMHGQWSNPAYADNRRKPQVIFPGGDGWLYAFAPQTGKLLWKCDCNPKRAVYNLSGRGTRSHFIGTPVVYDNKVYIGIGDDPERKYGVGHFWCVDITKTGDISEELAVNYRAKVTKENPTGVNTKKNPNSGVVWHFGGRAKKGNDREIVFGRTLSTCAVHDGLVYIAELEGYLHCLDAATGKQYWEHNLDADTYSSPYWVDNKVYIGTDDGMVYIFRHGKEKRSLHKDGIEMGGRIRVVPVAVNGKLYIATEGQLYAIANK